MILSIKNGQFMVSVYFGGEKIIFIVLWILWQIFDRQIQDGPRFLS